MSRPAVFLLGLNVGAVAPFVAAVALTRINRRIANRRRAAS